MRYHFVTPHHGGKLYDQLVTAIPACAPVATPVGPLARVLIESAGDQLWITVPDDVPESAIRAVLVGHDPTPPARVPSAEEAAEDEIAAATSVAALRAAMVRYLRAKRGVSA